MLERRFALIIANSEYQDPDLKKLLAPQPDAEALAKVLRNPEVGAFEVKVLPNEPSYKVMEEIEIFFDDRRTEDLLLLYFAGHGIKDKQELQLIERRQQELDEHKRQIENIRQDLEARENKLRSVEDLIPSSKYLKDIGIGFDQALVWIDCIKEVAQKERIDERTAAWKLADMLQSFKGLCGLENAIQQANQQLAMLNLVNDQQKRAITTLAYLQQIGMTEDEIGELVKLVGRWKGTAIGGISSMNGKLDDRLIGEWNID